MKIIGTFGLAIAASFTLMQSAEARGGGGAHFSGGGAHFSGGGAHYSGGAHFSGGGHYSGGARYYGGGPHYSGGARYYGTNRSYTRNSPTTTALRNPTYVNGSGRFAGNRTAAFNSRTYSRGNANVGAGNRTVANRSNLSNQGRVTGRYNASTWHRNWSHGQDHWWHGHRCHFQNGYWFLYDPFLWYPYGYGYGYYPYDGYYDSSYYDNGSYPVQEYEAGPQTNQSEYTGDARVSDVQSALAREGYYDGAVDGVLGPATRRALRNYQRDHGLDATGAINHGVIEALRLR